MTHLDAQMLTVMAGQTIDDLPFKPTQNGRILMETSYGITQTHSLQMLLSNMIRWNDTDGDGIRNAGDSMLQSSGNKFPDDTGWEDTDNDGVTDFEDDFPIRHPTEYLVMDSVMKFLTEDDACPNYGVTLHSRPIVMVVLTQIIWLENERDDFPLDPI